MRARFTRHLDRISYYLTTFAVGIAGNAFAIEDEQINTAIVTALVLAYLFLAVINVMPFITRSRPRVQATILAQTAIVSGLVLVAPEMNFFIVWFYILSVYAILTLPHQTAYLWMGVFTVVTFTILIIAYGWVGGLSSAIIYASGFAFFLAFARMTQRANEARQESERLLAALQKAHRELQDYAAKAEVLAVAEERNRLAREMHDTIGHHLTVSAVQLEAAQRLIPESPDRAGELVATVREQVRAALSELRQTVAALRQPLEHDLPLEIALPRLIADFEQATGLQVEFLWPENPPALSPPQRLTLYRTVQEGLTNIQKHAQASRAWVQVEVDGNVVTLRVSDDGLGPQGADSGFGLRGLEERAAQLDGEIHFGPRTGGGSQLTLTLPIER